MIPANADKNCESCPNPGPCVRIDDMWMCASCAARDKQIKAELAMHDDSLQGEEAKKQNRVVELTNRLIADFPANKREYFVKSIRSIVSIEQELADCENAKYVLASAVLEMMQQLRNRLTENLENQKSLKEQEVELRTDMIADQKYLNMLVPQLREEERAKFKDFDITYRPQVAISSTVKKPRVSATTSAYQKYADMLGISVEQAEKIMEQQIKAAVKCTCVETPGLCAVHPSK